MEAAAKRLRAAAPTRPLGWASAGLDVSIWDVCRDRSRAPWHAAEDYVAPMRTALDPEQGIEREYYPSNDRAFVWRAYRAMAAERLAGMSDVASLSFEQIIVKLFPSERDIAAAAAAKAAAEAATAAAETAAAEAAAAEAAAAEAAAAALAVAETTAASAPAPMKEAATERAVDAAPEPEPEPVPEPELEPKLELAPLAVHAAAAVAPADDEPSPAAAMAVDGAAQGEAPFSSAEAGDDAAGDPAVP